MIAQIRTFYTFKVELFKDNSNSGFLSGYMLNFLVSLIKIPGGLFAAVFLKKFPRRYLEGQLSLFCASHEQRFVYLHSRPVFLGASLLVVIGHLLMAWTLIEIVPKWCALMAITCAFFGYSAG